MINRKSFIRAIGLTAAMATLTLGVAAPASAGAGADRRVRIINDTRVTMTQFYASSVDADDWEEDILGNDVLRPGRSVRINIDDGTGECYFDFKAVFADGDVLVRERINVCSISEYRYR
ncbi:hypothetical protein [Brevundimonas vesicularis]|jgi:hypothetical protein|uniref:Tat pathway signal protein n=2 Tax=Brevundimonas vesicularis TaxID=41276 RepID=A0ABU4KUR7_BREVE|nr:hypothetical protein [Brevundimonas vesicularis]MDX2336631.1 hypothetical protein [Brevundimonas vesicularis]